MKQETHAPACRDYSDKDSRYRGCLLSTTTRRKASGSRLCAGFGYFVIHGCGNDQYDIEITRWRSCCRVTSASTSRVMQRVLSQVGRSGRALSSVMNRDGLRPVPSICTVERRRWKRAREDSQPPAIARSRPEAIRRVPRPPHGCRYQRSRARPALAAAWSSPSRDHLGLSPVPPRSVG